MSTGIAKPENDPDWSSARKVILSEMGEPLLRFMRDLFFNRASPSVDPTLISLARHLGWIAPDHSKHLQLTPRGARVADSAREYSNWLDDKRQLPADIVETEIRGQSVLDLGSGCGRHVFSASCAATLAVGLEAEDAYLQMASILRDREGLTAGRFVCGVAEKMPFADDTFDVVICVRSLFYMNAFMAIPEMARVLRIGGKAFIIVSTLGHFVSEFLGGPQHSPSIRERMQITKHVINSISVSLTGKQILRSRTKSKTASHVWLTRRRLLQTMENAGLRLVTHSPLNQLFVVERIR